MPCKSCGGTGKIDVGMELYRSASETWSLFGLGNAPLPYRHPRPTYQELIEDCDSCLGTGLGKEEAFALAKHIIDERVAEALSGRTND